MKYRIAPLKVLHWDQFTHLGGKNPMTGRLDLSYKIFPLTHNDVLPVLLNWTLVIYRECDIIFKYAAESKALIEFEHSEYVQAQLKMFVNDSLENFESYWEEHTEDTPLYGQVIPGFSDITLDRFVDDVLRYRREYSIS